MSEKLPKVSIVTVVFNAEELLEKTIKSVINQEYKNIEYIVIDGGSTDKTLKIIKKYEKYIHYWISEKDEGIYDAMNKAIKIAQGEWINFLNAGDFFCDNHVLSKINFLAHSNKSLIYGDHIAIDSDGNQQLHLAYEFTVDNIEKLTTRVACHQSMFFKHKEIPLYNLKYKLKSELDQYFYFAINYNKYEKLSFPISFFLEGGTGTQLVIRNTLERIKVIYKWTNLLKASYYGGKLLYGLIKILINNKRNLKEKI